jgi:hypothetical protein
VSASLYFVMPNDSGVWKFQGVTWLNRTQRMKAQDDEPATRRCVKRMTLHSNVID